MTPAETAQLLTIASVVDSRTVANETVLVWQEAIGHLEYDVAVKALNLHRQESTEYLLPAHVIRLAYRVRDARAIAQGPVFCPEHDEYPLPCERCLRDGVTS